MCPADQDQTFESVSKYIVNASTTYHRAKGLLPAGNATSSTSASASAAAPSAPAQAKAPALVAYGSEHLPDLPALERLLGPEHGQGATFVKFYAGWCPHCQAMAADYRELADRVHGEINVIEVACPEYPDPCFKYGIEGYPTLRLYKNGTATSFDDARTTQNMHRWLIDNGAVTGVTNVDAKSFDAHMDPRETAFLYLGEDDSQQRTLSYAVAALPVQVKVMVSTDPTLRARFGASNALFVFKDGRTEVPAARYTGPMDADAIAEWLEVEWYPTLTELSGTNLREVLYTATTHPIVLAMLPTNEPAEVARVQRLAVQWRQSARPSARFAWIDASVRDILESQHRLMLPEGDSIVLVAHPHTHRYAATPFLSEFGALEWLDRAVRSDPSVPTHAYGSLLNRGMANAHAAGTELQGIASAHPIVGLMGLCGVLMLVPRVRRAAFRVFARPAVHKMV